MTNSIDSLIGATGAQIAHPPSSIVKSAAFVLMTMLSIAIGLYAAAFALELVGSPYFHERFAKTPLFPKLHFIGGAVVLFTGAFQFWGPLRRSRPRFHRWLGRTYLSFVLLGGIAALILAPFSNGGIVAHFGFALLAIIWLFSGFMAYSAIRRGDIKTHKQWMMRNYALTFSAVTLRIYLGLFALAEIPFEEIYPLVAWLAWVPNLIVIDWFIALRK